MYCCVVINHRNIFDIDKYFFSIKNLQIKCTYKYVVSQSEELIEDSQEEGEDQEEAWKT